MERKKTNNRFYWSKIKHFILLTSALYLFWVILSGKFEAKYLLIGFLTAVTITAVTWPLLLMPWAGGKEKKHPAWDLPWFRLLTYFPWLLWQIILANIQVALIVLNPRLPIEPQLITFQKELPNPIAYLILANSITLTPGTVTVDLQGNRYLVHAINKAAAQGLVPEQGEGEMPRRVEFIFK